MPGRIEDEAAENRLDDGRLLRHEPLPAETRTWLNRFPEVRDLGLVVYSLEGFRLFLHEPQPRFGERTAVGLLATGREEEVYAALASDHEGLGF